MTLLWVTYASLHGVQQNINETRQMVCKSNLLNNLQSSNWILPFIEMRGDIRCNCKRTAPHTTTHWGKWSILYQNCGDIFFVCFQLKYHEGGCHSPVSFYNITPRMYLPLTTVFPKIRFCSGSQSFTAVPHLDSWNYFRISPHPIPAY